MAGANEPLPPSASDVPVSQRKDPRPIIIALFGVLVFIGLGAFVLLAASQFELQKARQHVQNMNNNAQSATDSLNDAGNNLAQANEQVEQLQSSVDATVKKLDSGKNTLAVSVDSLKGLATVSLPISEDSGEAEYTGVPLRTVLGKLVPVDTMEDMRNLTDAAVVVVGEDGFQAIVSAAALAADKSGKQYVLATARNGQPLIDSSQGAGDVRLIVPGDAKRVRWVRGVVSITLVRLTVN
jgi:hypothetical protein